MIQTGHIIYVEHRFDVEPFKLKSRDRVTWEVVEVRAEFSDPEEPGDMPYENIDLYGYPLRKDGERPANISSPKLVTGIPFDKRLAYEAQVREWCDREPAQP